MTYADVIAAIHALSATAWARIEAYEAETGQALASDSRFADRWFSAEERAEFARLQLLRVSLEPTTAEIRARVKEKRTARLRALDRSRDLP